MIDDRPIGTALNRNRGSATAPGEAVEAEIDQFIERRSRQKDPDEREELWKESVRAYNGRRREELRAARVEYHRGQAARLRTVLEALIADHEAQAERYRDQQIGEA